AGGLRLGCTSGQRQQRPAQVQHLGRVPLGDQLPGPVICDRVELAVANELDELRQGRQEIRIAAGDRYPLRGQGVAADLPAAVDVAEDEFVGLGHAVDVDG